MRGLSMLAGAAMSAAALVGADAAMLAAGKRFKRPARGGVNLYRVGETTVPDRRTNGRAITQLTADNAGKRYKPNGKREVARRLAQLFDAEHFATHGVTPLSGMAHYDGEAATHGGFYFDPAGQPSPPLSRYDCDPVPA